MKKLLLIIFVTLFNIQIKAQCWQSVAPAYGHTLAIKADGTLWAWGFNSDGMLGDGTTNPQNSPIQIGNATDWQKVAAGYSHSIAIKADGTLWAWGSNGFGQLGDGTNIDKLVPTQIGSSNDWSSVDCGNWSTIAIKSDGTMWAWGYNQTYGMLGLGDIVDRNSPTKIGSDMDWQTISVGSFHAVALKLDGTMWSWGNNAEGAIGDGTTVGNRTIPTNIGIGSTWQKISAGFLFTLAIKSDGTLWSWGHNQYGKLGDGTTINKNTPIEVGTSNTWKTISAGTHHSIALKTNNFLYSWGRNDYGALGDGTTLTKYAPTQIGNQTDWQTVAAGYAHNVALKTDSTLWSCGFNSDGQLGIGTNTHNSNFTQIICTTLGIEEVTSNNKSLTIFPNPSKVMINFQNTTTHTIDRIVVTDLSGKKVLEQNNNSESLNVQMLQPGMYLVKVFIEGRSYQNKFIKE